MVEHNFYNAFSQVSPFKKSEIVDFLFNNQEGEPVSKAAISDAVEYAIKERPSFGGFVITAYEKGEILGALVVNKTGLEKIDAQNRLVCMAIAPQFRGNGVASRLMKKAIHFSKGNLAVHLEPENSSVEVLRELGFKSKNVLELRFPNSVGSN